MRSDTPAATIWRFQARAACITAASMTSTKTAVAVHCVPAARFSRVDEPDLREQPVVTDAAEQRARGARQDLRDEVADAEDEQPGDEARKERHDPVEAPWTTSAWSSSWRYPSGPRPQQAMCRAARAGAIGPGVARECAQRDMRSSFVDAERGSLRRAPLLLELQPHASRGRRLRGGRGVRLGSRTRTATMSPSRSSCRRARRRAPGRSSPASTGSSRRPRARTRA